MASILSAGTTSATAMVHTADTSGVLQLASNNGTVALTIDTSQRVLFGTTSAVGTSLFQTTQAGINATSLTTTTVLNLGQKMSFTGVTNADGYIFGGIAMGGAGEEYAGIAAYDNGSSAATGLKFFTGTTSGIVTAMTINSTGQIGIGTASPQWKFDVYNASNSADTVIAVGNNDTSGTTKGARLQTYYSNLSMSALGHYWDGGAFNSYLDFYSILKFTQAGTEKARFSSSGYLGLNTTSPGSLLDVRGGSAIFSANGTITSGQEYTFINGGDRYIVSHGTSLNTATQYYFNNPNGTVGSISTSGTTTNYNTSSDYRLKDNVQPMQNALDKVALLKPVTFTWNTDGTDGEGFIAHELQAVVPIAVYGEKDAVEDYGDVLNEDGSVRYPDVRTPTTPEEGTTFVKKGERPVYQSVDTSHLVATLTAAIQELNAKVTALENK